MAKDTGHQLHSRRTSVAYRQEPDGCVSFACAGLDFKQSSVHTVTVLPVNTAFLQTYGQKGRVWWFDRQGDKMCQTSGRHSTQPLKPWPALFLTQCMAVSNCLVIIFLGLVQTCETKCLLTNILVFPKSLVQTAVLT